MNADIKDLCPFVGMRPYLADEVNTYHGRERELRKALALLKSRGLLILFGKSGVGKSSFITAGIIPHIEDLGASAHIKFNCSDPNFFKEFSEYFSQLNSSESVGSQQSFLVVFDQFEGLLKMSQKDREKVLDMMALIINSLSRQQRIDVLISIQTEYFYTIDELLDRSPSIISHRQHLLSMDKDLVAEVFQSISQSVDNYNFLSPTEITSIVHDIYEVIQENSEFSSVSDNLLIGFAQLIFREIWIDRNTSTTKHSIPVGRPDDKSIIEKYVDHLLGNLFSYSEKMLIFVVSRQLVESYNLSLSWSVYQLVSALDADSFPHFSRSRWMTNRIFSLEAVQIDIENVFQKLAEAHPELVFYDHAFNKVQFQHRVVLEALRFWRNSYQLKLANEGAWMAYCERVINEQQLGYYFFGVSVDVERNYSLKYLEFLANQVAKTTGTSTPRVEKKIGTSFNTIVDELVEHRAALGEFAYYDEVRSWRADFVSVGDINFCVCVCNLENAKWLEKILDQEYQNLVDRSNTSIDRLMGSKVSTIENAFLKIDSEYNRHASSIIAQTGTTIEDELERIAKNNKKTNRQSIDDWETAYNLMRDPLAIYLSIKSEVSTISKKPHNHLAFLDWRIACNMADRYVDNENCYFFVLKYNNPLPAGYFFPKGDLKFGNIILNAVKDSLMISPSVWKETVIQDMKNNLITPHKNGPKIISSL